MKEIQSRFELAKFIESLSQEAAAENNDWIHKDLSTFLESMSAWIEDMDGYYENRGETTPEQPTWETIAEIVKAATVYE